MKKKELIKKLKEYNFKSSNIMKCELEKALSLLEEGYNINHVKIILNCIKDNLETKYLMNKDLNFIQVKNIYNGLVDSLDVSKYANLNTLSLIKGYEILSSKVDISDSDFDKYVLNDNFGIMEIKEILLGITEGIDISLYDNPEKFNYSEMRYIRKSLKYGVNISNYEKIYRNSNRFEQITSLYKLKHFGNQVGVINKVLDNSSKYSKSFLNDIILLIENSFDIEKYLGSNFESSEEVKIIANSIKNNVDLLPYLNKGYDANQLNLIYIGLNSNLDISKYLQFNSKKMTRIIALMRIGKYDDSLAIYDEVYLNLLRKGYEKDICLLKYIKANDSILFLEETLKLLYLIKDNDFYKDFSLYELVEDNLTINQIKQLIFGVKDNININLYANTDFNEFQMKEIRFGLKNEINVEIYSDSDIDVKKMRAIRLSLQKKTFKRSNFFKFDTSLNKFTLK